jgi:hypothetical protein
MGECDLDVKDQSQVYLQQRSKSLFFFSFHFLFSAALGSEQPSLRFNDLKKTPFIALQTAFACPRRRAKYFPGISSMQHMFNMSLNTINFTGNVLDFLSASGVGGRPRGWHLHNRITICIYHVLCMM